MRVIGTAGHVDHGKSALVEALTGIHPDRLKEEREREMTIDLGFAWLTLPDGETVGVVDVPGHRDFIENMLAGVGGIDAVVFVVAADEGVMPQTREHLAILDLLQIEGGVIALTKTCLVERPKRPDLGRPRLPIDRVFTIPGFGTVVTGTLIDGRFGLGEEVEVLPAGLRGRIRGLQSHKHKEQNALPGSRTAVNVSGLEVDQIQRGAVL